MSLKPLSAEDAYHQVKQMRDCDKISEPKRASCTMMNARLLHQIELTTESPDQYFKVEKAPGQSTLYYLTDYGNKIKLMTFKSQGNGTRVDFFKPVRSFTSEPSHGFEMPGLKPLDGDPGTVEVSQYATLCPSHVAKVLESERPRIEKFLAEARSSFPEMKQYHTELQLRQVAHKKANAFYESYGKFLDPAHPHYNLELRWKFDAYVAVTGRLEDKKLRRQQAQEQGRRFMPVGCSQRAIEKLEAELRRQDEASSPKFSKILQAYRDLVTQYGPSFGYGTRENPTPAFWRAEVSKNLPGRDVLFRQLLRAEEGQGPLIDWSEWIEDARQAIEGREIYIREREIELQAMNRNQVDNTLGTLCAEPRRSLLIY